jgi:hypothetical protein
MHSNKEHTMSSDHARQIKAQLVLLNQIILETARKLEMQAVDVSTIYEVYESDSDLVEGKLLFQTLSRDLAESKALSLFKDSYGEGKDFIVYNRKIRETILILLCDASAAKRGECRA